MSTLRTLMTALIGLALMGGCAAKQKVDQGSAVKTATAPKQNLPNKNRSEDRLRAQLSGQQEGIAMVPIYFEFDSSRLRQDSQEHLVRVAAFMKKHPKVELTIEGHADERGTSEYNLALGDRRARTTTDFLTSLGVSSTRVKVLSYGEERPAQAGTSEEAWAKNRRAEFVRRRG